MKHDDIADVAIRASLNKADGDYRPVLALSLARCVVVDVSSLDEVPPMKKWPGSTELFARALVLGHEPLGKLPGHHACIGLILSIRDWR